VWSEGIEIVIIPYQVPNSNANSGRWALTTPEECLDRVIVLNQRYLQNLLTEHVAYYNARRPSQGLAQGGPLGLGSVTNPRLIHYCNVLGVVMRDYYREAS
jgi:hypothetical protein